MLLSIVIPVYNEAESLPKLFQALTQILSQIDADYELLFVNDGSNDDSLRFLRGVASSDPRVKVLGFSRNFGQLLLVNRRRIVRIGMPDNSRSRRGSTKLILGTPSRKPSKG